MPSSVTRSKGVWGRALDRSRGVVSERSGAGKKLPRELCAASYERRLTLLSLHLDDRDVSDSIETSIFGEAYTPGQSSVANVEAPNRGPTYGTKGVAADHPLSAQAGMQ